MTYKWSVVRETIKKYRPDIPSYPVSNSTKKSYGKITLNEGISLFDALPVLGGNTKSSDYPLTFEDLDVDYGLILYRTNLWKAGTMDLGGVYDRAYVMADKKIIQILQRTQEKKFEVNTGPLEILVEHQGRINYGNEWIQRKGLPDGVRVDSETVKGWDHHGFNLSCIENIEFEKEYKGAPPAFFRGVFQVSEIGDTFLNPKGWTKGVAFVNGFNLGRYWTIGPQLTLYVPRHLLKMGENEVILFEYEKVSETRELGFDDTPQIDIIK
jgi:beta-galactosidase